MNHIQTIKLQIEFSREKWFLAEQNSLNSRVPYKPDTALVANIRDIGNLHETCFLSCFRKEEVAYSNTGDFRGGKSLFEVGEKNKDSRQISGVTDSYLALDGFDVDTHRVPSKCEKHIQAEFEP